MFALTVLAIGTALAAVFDAAGAGTVSCDTTKRDYVADKHFAPGESKLVKASVYCTGGGKPSFCSFEGDGTIYDVTHVNPDVGTNALCGLKIGYRCYCSTPDARGRVTLTVKKDE